MAITSFELGWLVALLEGEGTFRFQNRTCHVVIKMTDQDTIERYIDVIEKVTGRRYIMRSYDREHENRQQIYQVNICGENARQVMSLIVSHMSYRRRQRIWQSLNGHFPKKLKLDISNLIESIIKKPVVLRTPEPPLDITLFKRRA